MVPAWLCCLAWAAASGDVAASDGCSNGGQCRIRAGSGHHLQLGREHAVCPASHLLAGEQAMLLALQIHVLPLLGVRPCTMPCSDAENQHGQQCAGSRLLSCDLSRLKAV